MKLEVDIEDIGHLGVSSVDLGFEPELVQRTFLV